MVELKNFVVAVCLSCCILSCVCVKALRDPLMQLYKGVGGDGGVESRTNLRVGVWGVMSQPAKGDAGYST